MTNDMTDNVMLNWTDAKRKMLVSLLERLIPPNAARRVPGAGELGIATILERQTHDDPQLCNAITHLLDACAAGEDTDEGTRVSAQKIVQLEHDESVPFTALLRATYMAYYCRPDVRAVLGLSPLPTQPRGYDVPVEPPELLAALLEPVRTRGRVYRPA